MTGQEIMLLTVAVAALILLRPAYLLIIVARGSIRRLAYRLAVARNFRHPAPSDNQPQQQLGELLVAAAEPPAPATDQHMAVSQVLESCIEAYAGNKMQISSQLHAELKKLTPEERGRLRAHWDELQAMIAATTVAALQLRLQDVAKGSLIDNSFIRKMVVNGSNYYVRDFALEVHNALRRLDN